MSENGEVIDMGETIYNLAFDFGASSGRMILSKFENGKIELEELHRFSNDPVRIGKNFYWDTFRLYHELKQGLKKAAAKTYTKELPATSTTSKKTAQTSSASVVTKTTVVKKIEEKYTKKSKVKVVTTVATTTVTTTTTAKAGVSTGVNSAGTVNNSGVTGTVEVGQLAPKEDSRVLTAYRTLGFKVNVDPSVSYSGYFNARNRQITLKKANETIYHELGHFIAFIAGNVDTTSEFKTIYNQEKSLYTAYNKAYVTQNSSEYFAESAKEYVLNPGALKAARPKTYEAVRSAVESITDERIAKIQKYYGAIWK